MPGRIRVGRSKFIHGRTIYPSYPNFIAIIVLTLAQSIYGILSPYYLRNEKGQILENVHQFSKAYLWVPQVAMPYSSRNRQIVWRWPAETHLDADENPTPEYWRWRMAGKNNPEPVRAPVGWKHLENCKYSLEKDEPLSETNPKLGYREARKRIYFPEYIRAVVKEPLFQELKQRWLNGENLLIVDVDGPREESLDYYQQKWHVPEDFIDQDSVEATEQNLAILLEDLKHPFGHGYCLAWAIQKY